MVFVVVKLPGGNLLKCYIFVRRRSDAIKAYHAIASVDPSIRKASDFFTPLDDGGGDIRVV